MKLSRKALVEKQEISYSGMLDPSDSLMVSLKERLQGNCQGYAKGWKLPLNEKQISSRFSCNGVMLLSTRLTHPELLP